MTLLDEALAALAERRFTDAVELAQRALASGDMDGESMYERGLPADFTRPNRAKCHYVIGTAKSETGDKHGAIVAFDAALEQDPRDHVTFSNRAIAKRDLGDEEGALLDFDRALECQPLHPHARANRARLLAKRGAELERADEDYVVLLVVARTPEHRAEWDALRRRRSLPHDDIALASAMRALPRTLPLQFPDAF
jgi:tetratricopeptide (TPR) repeat protein